MWEKTRGDVYWQAHFFLPHHFGRSPCFASPLTNPHSIQLDEEGGREGRKAVLLLLKEEEEEEGNLGFGWAWAALIGASVGTISHWATVHHSSRLTQRSHTQSSSTSLFIFALDMLQLCCVLFCFVFLISRPVQYAQRRERLAARFCV